MSKYETAIIYIKCPYVLNYQVVEMEADVLKTLNYEMGNPTIKTFLR